MEQGDAGRGGGQVGTAGLSKQEPKGGASQVTGDVSQGRCTVHAQVLRWDCDQHVQGAERPA